MQKSSCKQLMVFICAVLEITPSFSISLDLSTVLIWSNRISPFFPWNVHWIRVGELKPLEIIGATIAVFKEVISSVEITIHGLVFLISEPCVGFNCTNQISNLWIFCFTIPIPLHQLREHQATLDLSNQILLTYLPYQIALSNLALPS